MIDWHNVDPNVVRQASLQSSSFSHYDSLRREAQAQEGGTLVHSNNNNNQVSCQAVDVVTHLHPPT